MAVEYEFLGDCADSEFDVLKRRFFACGPTMLISLEDALLKERRLRSFECDGYRIAFVATFECGAVVTFEFEDGDGDTFYVELPDGESRKVVYSDRGSPVLGANINWMELVSRRPYEFAVRAVDDVRSSLAE